MNDKRVDFFMPLYVRDFFSATLGWTAEEKGHYMTLLMVQWDREALPQDMPSLERLSPGVSGHWDLIGPKFPPCHDGLLRNRRLEEHRAKALDLRQKRAEAGAKGGRGKAKAGLEQSYDFADAKGCHPEPEPPIPPPPNGGGGYTPTASSKTPPPASGSRGSVNGKLWQDLLAAWQDGPGVPWSLRRPPAEAVARLADPEWLEVAKAAILRLHKCKFFRDPVDLVQFCGDGFAERVVGGRYDRRYRASDDDCRESADAAAERWKAGAEESARRAAKYRQEREEARR